VLDQKKRNPVLLEVASDSSEAKIRGDEIQSDRETGQRKNPLKEAPAITAGYFLGVVEHAGSR
jgi:hypothetical protein